MGAALHRIELYLKAFSQFQVVKHEGESKLVSATLLRGGVAISEPCEGVCSVVLPLIYSIRQNILTTNDELSVHVSVCRWGGRDEKREIGEPYSKVHSAISSMQKAGTSY